MQDLFFPGTPATRNRHTRVWRSVALFGLLWGGNASAQDAGPMTVGPSADCFDAFGVFQPSDTCVLLPPPTCLDGGDDCEVLMPCGLDSNDCENPTPSFCGEIPEIPFPQLQTGTCANKDVAGTVVVTTQGELDAYHIGFGADGGKLKNLNVAFNPAGDVNITSPCHVKVSGKNGVVDIDADSLLIYGRLGVQIALDAGNPDVGVSTTYGQMLISPKGTAGYHKGLDIEASEVCVQAENSAFIGQSSTVSVGRVELISTGDTVSSTVSIRQDSDVVADTIYLEASRGAFVGQRSVVDALSMMLVSTGDTVKSVASIDQAATVEADYISLVSGNKLNVGKNADVTATGILDLVIATDGKCTVASSASLDFNPQVSHVCD